ncbi:MAG: ribonuclease catalytic domain-containing protein [Thermodesulfobacteriota bacterium]
MNKIPAKTEVVVYRKRSQPCLGVMLETGPEKASIFSEEGKELSIDLTRIVRGAGIKYGEDMDESEIELALRGLRRELEEGTGSIDLVTLWECVLDSERELSFNDIKELYFESGPTDAVEELILFWAVDKSDLYFKRQRSGGYLPRSRDEAAGIRRRKEAERKKLLEAEAAIKWVRAVMEDTPAEDTEYDFEGYVELIKDFVIHLDNFDKAPQARSFIARAGLKNTDEAIQFLIKTGNWTENDDPVFLRLGITKTFPKIVEEETDSVLSSPVSYDGLADLTGVSTYSIDDVNTEDIDDAVSISLTAQGPVLGVHIADVDVFVGKGTQLDEEALKRGETIYLPEGHVHMFPPRLIRDRLSLIEGEAKKALSLLVYFDKHLNINNYTFAGSKIAVDKNLLYSEAEDKLRRSEEGSLLFEIAHRLRQDRICSGGCVLDLPDLKIRVSDDGEIALRTVTMTTPAHILIAECMILMNVLAGAFLRSAHLPAIYRYLTEEVPEEVRTIDMDDPLYPIRALKFLRPSRFSLTPLPHRFVGVDTYVQVTSPIRRYLDLVMQRQILRKVKGLSPAYGPEELERIYQRVELGIRDKRTVERARTKFWLFKYLEKMKGEVIKGYVSQTGGAQTTVYFPQYLLEAPVSLSAHEVREVGTPLECVIENVEPIRRKISLTPLQEPSSRIPGAST